MSNAVHSIHPCESEKIAIKYSQLFLICVAILVLLQVMSY